jgi:hypothetical protein
MPAGLDVTYFVNSGAGAERPPALMARAFTGNNDVVGVRNATTAARRPRWRSRRTTPGSFRSSPTWQSITRSTPIRTSPFDAARPEEIAHKSAEDIT